MDPYLPGRPREVRIQVAWVAPAAATVLVLLAAGIVLLPAGRGRISSHGPFGSSKAFGTVALNFERFPAEARKTQDRFAAASETEGTRFLLRGHRASVTLAAGEIAVNLRGSDGTSTATQTATIRMTLPGSNDNVEPIGVDRLVGRTHVLIGNDPSQWQRGIPHFSKVRYEEIYPGVDLVFYGNPDDLEYDFVVAPYADPANIRIAFEGAGRLRVDDQGDLVLRTKAGEVRHRRPRAYQVIDGHDRKVQAHYEIDPQGVVRFAVGEFDRWHPLILDPVLAYATYLGGIDTDLGHAIAVDSEGCAYITGQAVSPNFPRTPGFPEPNHLDGDTSYAYVTKLDPSGSRILYSTVFGGSDYDIGNAIEVDSSGAAYIVGESRSEDFPATTRAIQRSHAGGRDAFVAKLSPDGSTLVYATYLGGSEVDLGNALAIDAAGSAYVSGVTVSADFPTTSNAYQREYASREDVFVAKLSPDGSRLLYSTYVGSVGDDEATGMTVDRSGNVYLAGTTATRRALGPSDAYCLKLNPTGSEVVYLKLFGGTGVEEANAVTVDDAGNAYLTGTVFSKDFPTTPGVFQPASRSPLPDTLAAIGYDAFVAKINPRGQDLVFSTFLNGSVAGVGRAIRLDPEGNIVVAGFTRSEDFPVTAGALTPPDPVREFKGFLAKLDPNGRELLYSTRIGGSALQNVWDMTLDQAGNAYLVGSSISQDFPVTERALQTTLGGAFDAFVVKFSASSTPVVAASGVVSGASFLPGAVAPGMVVSIFGSGLSPAEGALLEVDDDGLVRTQLRGTRVLFNDIPAPLIFTAQNQVSAIAPYALAGESSVQVVVECGGARSDPVAVVVAESAPALFTYDSSGAGQGAILNADGSVNTPQNPAQRGSIIVLYGTGEGQTEPAGEDGRITGDAPPRPELPVSVLIGGREAEILFAGEAPGLVAGVIQVNARIPSNLAETGDVPVVLQIGSATSQTGVTLAVR